MAPCCLFQDDIIHGAQNVIKARVASNKVATMMAKKNLKLNEDKCIVIAMGTKKQREKVKIDLESNPTMCGNFEMEMVEKTNGWGSRRPG